MPNRKPRMELSLKPEVDTNIRKLAKANGKNLSAYVEDLLNKASKPDDFRSRIKIINFRFIQSGKLLAKCDIQYGRLVICGFKIFGGGKDRIGVKPPQERFEHNGEIKHADMVWPASVQDERWFAQVKEAILRHYIRAVSGNTDKVVK